MNEHGALEAPTTIRHLVFDPLTKMNNLEIEAPREPAADIENPRKVMEFSVADEANLDEMTVDELQHHQEEVNRKIREKQEAEKQAVIEQIVNVVHTYNIPIDELVEKLGGLKIKRKGVKAIQKYQDPANPEKTWSGRGKEPLWIRGKDHAKFLI